MEDIDVDSNWEEVVEIDNRHARKSIIIHIGVYKSGCCYFGIILEVYKL